MAQSGAPLRSDVKAASLYDSAALAELRTTVVKRAEAQVGVQPIMSNLAKSQQNVQFDEKAANSGGGVSAGQVRGGGAVPPAHKTASSALAVTLKPTDLAKRAAALLPPPKRVSLAAQAKRAVCEMVGHMERSSAGDGSKKPKEIGQVNGAEAWEGLTKRRKIGS